MPHRSGSSRWGSYRGRKRSESHRQAHEDAAAVGDLPPILDHPLVPQGEPELITSQAAFDDLVASLRNQGRFGYDTEFIGEHTSYPKICVVQVATGDHVWLIDALAEIDLRPLWELLADPAVEKIVHAGEQDLEPVMRNLGPPARPPQNIFDTQIAAAFTGCPYPSSLRRLAELLLGADLGHGLKFSQWDHRPLTNVQRQYAANDVRYLPLLRHRIGERLEELGNTAWAAEECAALAEPSRYVTDADSLRLRSMAWLSPREIAVARSLLEWREDLARHENMPPRTLVTDGVLLDLARTQPKTQADLARVRNLPRPVRRDWGDVMLKRIAESRDGAADGPFTPPAKIDWTAERARVNAVWTKIAERARQREIDPAIVTSKKELAGHLRAEGKRRTTRLTRGWRVELLAGLEELS
jgi:ribonuclease D